jgi:vacuolar protein sorting-associated protein 1
MGCIDRWRQPALSCFLAVVTTLSNFVDGLLATHFGRFRKLERHMRYKNLLPVPRCHADPASRLVTRTELDKYKDRGSQALENALERENFPVFVGNIKDFDSARNKWLAHYNREWQNSGRRAFPPIGRSSGSRWSNGPDSEDENVVDDFEDELVVMAEVHAYFEVAHKVSNRPALLSTH